MNTHRNNSKTAFRRLLSLLVSASLLMLPPTGQVSADDSPLSESIEDFLGFAQGVAGGAGSTADHRFPGAVGLPGESSEWWDPTAEGPDSMYRRSTILAGLQSASGANNGGTSQEISDEEQDGESLYRRQNLSDDMTDEEVLSLARRSGIIGQDLFGSNDISQDSSFERRFGLSMSDPIGAPSEDNSSLARRFGNIGLGLDLSSITFDSTTPPGYSQIGSGSQTQISVTPRSFNTVALQSPSGWSFGGRGNEESESGLSISANSFRPTAVLAISDVENEDQSGSNDSIGTAQFLDMFGTAFDEDADADIEGFLSPISITTLDPFAEDDPEDDDGSIGGANPLSLTNGSIVKIGGAEIGDGLHGSSGDATGDFDLYAISLAAGDTVTVDIDTSNPTGDLDSIIGVFDQSGSLIDFNDNDMETLDSFLAFDALTAGTYYFAIGGFTPGSDPTIGQPFPLADPSDAGSGRGVGSEGTYDVSFGLNIAPDIDFYSFDLEAGDVIGATVIKAGASLDVFDHTDSLLIGSDVDLGFIYPDNSPLPKGGRSSVAFVAPQAGQYTIAVSGNPGEYSLDLQVFRPLLERILEPATQIIFLDFNGATLDTTPFDGGGTNTLSPLNDFLANWGLIDSDLNSVINAIIEEFTRSISFELRNSGINGDFAASGNPGEFDVIVLNSRDHADPFGLENVSRIIIGGTNAEAGIGLPTLGIAESVDVGNFDTTETALVLLDILSGPASDPFSLNSFAIDAGSTIIDLIGTAVGNIAAHEAGHFLGAFHTDRNNDVFNIMDQGGFLDDLIGIGPDGVFGTADDIIVGFLLTDIYDNEFEPFVGVENVAATLVYGMSTSIVSGGADSPVDEGTGVVGILPPGWARVERFQDPFAIFARNGRGGISGPIGGGDGGGGGGGIGGGGGFGMSQSFGVINHRSDPHQDHPKGVKDELNDDAKAEADKSDESEAEEESKDSETEADESESGESQTDEAQTDETESEESDAERSDEEAQSDEEDAQVASVSGS